MTVQQTQIYWQTLLVQNIIHIITQQNNQNQNDSIFLALISGTCVAQMSDWILLVSDSSAN